MGQFSFWHLLLVLGVVLIFFGPSRLPGLGNSLGKAIRGFKEGIKGEDEERDASNDSLPPGEKKDSEKRKS
jgi:sec-independent protein translocase protein TatA